MSGSSLISEHDLDPNLKLPVQNGGLYINSETTEEDKAEAQEALKEIGLATAIQSLIDSGVIEVGGLMPPIKAVESYFRNSTISGTGKGRIFVDGGSRIKSMTIDGKSIPLTYSIESSAFGVYAHFEIDFKESYSITAENSTTCTRVTILFY